MKLIAVIAVVTAGIALGGCQSFHAQQADAECRSYGAKPGTDAYVNCRVAVEQSRQRKKAILLGAGLGLLAAGATPPPRPVTCTGTRMGNMATATCY